MYFANLLIVFKFILITNEMRVQRSPLLQKLSDTDNLSFIYIVVFNWW